VAPSAVAGGDDPQANRAARWWVGGAFVVCARVGAGSGFELVVAGEGCADRAALGIALIAWLGDGWLLG